MAQQEFKDQVAVVTGASAGIGKAIAMVMAEQGATVILSDIDRKKGEAMTSLIAEKGGKAEFVMCDVADREQVGQLFDHIEKTYGRLDLAVNNAGIEGDSSIFHECTFENWQQVMDINLTGVFQCMKHELRIMDQQEKGSIVNVSSIAGLVGAAGLPAYDASKHGVLGLTQSAALDYSRKGIRINAVCPGPIRTEMIERIIEQNPQVEETIKAGTPNGRIGEPEEVAEAVIWLCSDKASLVTGQSLPVDGGWLAQ